MTFGEHLEELRICLFKAILGLVAGVVIGLIIGGTVVDIIQRPLSNALTAYFQNQSLARAEAKLQELKDAGQVVPEAKQLQDLVRHEQLLPEEAYVDPSELLEQLKAIYPEQLKGVQSPSPKADGELHKSDLVRMFLWHRLEDDARIQLKTLSAHEAFTIYMKASLLVGVLISSPWVFYQLWSFVAAGLYPHEKRYVQIFLPFSLGLFLAGAALAFFFVFKPVLAFLFSFNSWMGIEPDPRISEWLGFVLVLPLGFGIGFQLPLVMLFLERIGVFSVEFYRKQWRISVLAIAVIAMILTPPDPYSMLLMAVPLTGLYFGGIALCRFMPRLRSPYRGVEE